MKKTLLGTIAYVLVTFPLAVLWHVGLFESSYQAFGYFNGEPNFLLGLMTILVQGAVLSFLYPFVNFRHHGVGSGIKYALVMGIFIWSAHVLGFMAKQNPYNPQAFLLMESAYLMLQFVVYGSVLGLIHQKKDEYLYQFQH